MSSPARPHHQASFGTKLEYLFDTIRPPKSDGGERKHRNKSTYSNDELAAAVREYTGERCSRDVVGFWRKDLSTPSATQAEAIAVFFGMPPAYFHNDEKSAAMMEQLEVLGMVDEVRGLLAEMHADKTLLREFEQVHPADFPTILGFLQTLRRHRKNLIEGSTTAEPAD